METVETNKINSVTAQEMRNQLSDLINRAAYLKEPTLITRQGKAVAVLVSVADWEHYIYLRKIGDIPAADSVDVDDEEKSLDNGEDKNVQPEVLIEQAGLV